MHISHIHRFEKLRDGGSLIVSFQADDSCEYWVMFPIENMDLENPLFKPPVLVNRTTGIEVNLSRDGAKNWLCKLEPYFNQRAQLPYVSKQTETEIYKKMVTLCEVGT